MKRFAVLCLVIVAMLLGSAEAPTAQCGPCGFIEIITLLNTNIIVGWPVDSNVNYWVAPGLPSDMKADAVSAVATWDGECNP